MPSHVSIFPPFWSKYCTYQRQHLFLTVTVGLFPKSQIPLKNSALPHNLSHYWTWNSSQIIPAKLLMYIENPAFLEWRGPLQYWNGKKILAPDVVLCRKKNKQHSELKSTSGFFFYIWSMSNLKGNIPSPVAKSEQITGLEHSLYRAKDRSKV